MNIPKHIQAQIVDDLASLYDVHDVYWFKNKLYVINSYDIPFVKDYADSSENGRYIIFQYIENDEFEFA